MKLFAAIFLDGELNGSPLEGLDYLSVACELIDYLDTSQAAEDRTPIISPEAGGLLKKHLERFAQITKNCYQAGASRQKDQITAISDHILKELASSGDIFFPGGWYAEPEGHAIVYRLFYDKTGSLVFLAYNTGEGTQYHKKIDCGKTSKLDVETYREQFNPVYAIRFENAEKLKQPGELQAWIDKLLEPNILPRYAFDYHDNNAQSIYQKILPLSAYLNGKVVDPEEYFPWTTTGQKSGTCAQYSMQQAVRTFLENDLQYERFILNYRLHVLNKFIDEEQLPKLFQDHYHQAIAHTARMITTGRMLEKTLNPAEKQILLDELTAIQKKAQAYFKALPETLKPQMPIPEIIPEDLSIPSNEASPEAIEATQAIPSLLEPCPSLLLFNPEGTLCEAIFCLHNMLERVDKRLFIYNLEQLCFIFCDQIKDFKTRPLEASQEDIEAWAKVIPLLHQYSFEYFDFYFKDHYGSDAFSIVRQEDRQRYAASWFKEERLKDNELSAIKRSPVKSLHAASSPRNQMMGLALMTLQHYAAMQYHGALLDLKENWQATLTHVDYYTAYMQDWMIHGKMQRDFFLSSTDPNLSHLFQSLNEYYSGYAYDFNALSLPGRDHISTILIEHYSNLMQTPYFKEEKEALEALFDKHGASIRSHCRLESDLEQALVHEGLIALFMYLNASDLSEDEGIKWPETPKLKQLMRIHYHTDLTVVLGTKALLYGSDTSLGEEKFVIDATLLRKLYATTALTGSLREIPYNDTKENSSWRYGHQTSALANGINQVAQGSGKHTSFHCDPLFHDVVKKPYTSNQISLLAEGAGSKMQRHLRTALPLQALQLLDYYTQHTHLLEERDDQFYLLFSLFQPGVIDQGLANNADLLLAIQTLYQKGIALGDLSRDTPLLTHRGLFLIKLSSWVLGYVLSAHPDKTAYQTYYETINEDVRYWIAHTQPEPIQTELNRVFFYNIMKQYEPKVLSLPTHRGLLIDSLFSYLTLTEHRQDRVPGTITKTEDESFESLILNLLLLDPEAVQEALCVVLGRLFKDQAPFQGMVSEAISKGIYTYIDSHQQKISVRLLDGQIIAGENNLAHIPTSLRRQNNAYKTLMGSEYDPPAIRLNETRYQFEWCGDTYCLSDKQLFKKMDDAWYQYHEDDFLPKVLQQNGQFAWVGEEGEYAFIMQKNEQHEWKQIGVFKEWQLYLLEPKGVFCLEGYARTHIAQAFNAFEQASMIAVIELEDEPDTYQFQLPYYQLSGKYSSEQGLIIDYQQDEYAVVSEETPFDTGIWLGNRPDASKTERLYLVPIRPFYKQESQNKETINDVHYHLQHDVQRTMHDDLDLEKKYAAFHFDSLGRLTADACSTDSLYLAYLYCGRYEFDRAYELINQYTPQGKPEELVYLHWLCEKLPAKSSSNKQITSIFMPDKNAIVTPMLLAIQLKSLLLLRKLNHDPALKKGLSQEMLDCLSNPRFIDFTIDIYNKYHRLSDHLSDDKKLPVHDLEMIASDIYLSLETMKEEEIKKLNQLLQDKTDLMQKITLQKESLLKIQSVINSLKEERRFAELEQANLSLKQYEKEHQQDTKILDTLDFKIKEQHDGIQSLIVKQHSGYLGLVQAKKPQLFHHESEPTTHDFFTRNTAEYREHVIEPVWPVQQYEPTHRGYNNYAIHKVEGSLNGTVIKPNVIYISSNYAESLNYAFLDAAGNTIIQSVYSIKDDSINPIILKSNEALSSAEQQALRSFVLSQAIKSDTIESGVGTLQTIQTLMSSPKRQDGFEAGCNALSLNISDDVLLSHLKDFFCLALQEEGLYLAERNRLRAFCVETIIACEDLNEALKKTTPLSILDSKAALDKRRSRLSIAIVLLKALDYPKEFKASYQAVVGKCMEYSEATLKKRSLWTIVSDKEHGFYKAHLLENRLKPSPPILSQAGVPVLRTHKIKKHLRKPPRTKLLHTLDDSALQKTHLKHYELPPTLVSLSDTLNRYHNAYQIARQELIQSFEKKTDLEKRSSYDVIDQELDKLEQSYRKQLLESMPDTFNIPESRMAIHTMLAGLSADIIDSSMALKQHAAFLPLKLQDLLSMRVDQFSGKQAPMDLDRLLLHYASGIDEGYLTSRYVPSSIVPKVRRRLNDFLRQVFLYRQYQHILTALIEVHTTHDPFEQAEKKLYFAGRMLELAPLEASPALTLFQHQTQKTVRQKQWAMIDRLTKADDSSNRAEQLMMGEGKTKVILPESIFLKADGIHLAMVLVPDALLQTEYQDLKYTAKTVYNQDIVLFQFDRNSPCDPISLRRYLSDFEDILLQRKGLIMTPSSLQSLYLKRRELLYQAQYYQEHSLEYSVVVEQLTILKDLVRLFENKADVIADELHKVLDINIELNYSIGEQRSIEPEHIETTLNLFNFLESTPIAVADETDMLFILNNKSLSDFLANPSMLYHPEALIDKLIDYYESRYLEQYDPSLHSEKARNLLAAQWRVFLGTTLKSKIDERYGRSLSEDVSIAIPYAGNNVPTRRLFENFVESMNYTIQMTHLKGVPFAVFKSMMRAWKKSDQQDCLSPLSEAEKRYQACLDRLSMDDRAELPHALKAVDVVNEQVLEALYVHFQYNNQFIRYALEEHILPSIKIYPHKLTSNAIHLTHLVHRIQGVSGTLGSHPTFAKSIHFNQASSFGVKNKIKALLSNKETQMFTSAEKNDYQGISALIDIGAHERGKSNQQVAMELALHFQESDIQYVLFFKEDQLAAWKVGGTDVDIIMLPSTDAAVIEKYLGVTPEQRFTYYAQTNATGTDILQAREARARVTLDVTTTLSDFLQAVMRMRQLFAGQTIEIVIAPALKEKLGDTPTLDNLYKCLEEFEDDKLANDVFKSACKQLLDVVQNDFERRLLDMDAKTSIRLFHLFQSLLVGENLTVLPAHYGKEETRAILLQIKENVLAVWNQAMDYPDADIPDSGYETHASIEKQCDDIIEQAMIFCRKDQQTSLSLGTEISMEQQQETQVQVQLYMEQQTDPRSDLLNARHPNLAWANILSIDEQGVLTGADDTHNRLGFIWDNSPDAGKIDWSNNLWLSTDFYMIHNRQPINTLPSGLSQKPVFATLFWKPNDADEVQALVVSQEEAEVVAQRLTSGNLNSESHQIWLETSGCDFALAGIRPINLAENESYQILKEQISVFDGSVALLAQKKEWVWFKPYHIPILQQQMMKQEKLEDATLLVALAQKMNGKVNTRATSDYISAKDFLLQPPVSKPQALPISQLELPVSEELVVVSPSVDEIPCERLSPDQAELEQEVPVIVSPPHPEHSEGSPWADTVPYSGDPSSQAPQDDVPGETMTKAQDISGVGTTQSEPLEELDCNPTSKIPHDPKKDYASIRQNLNETIKRLPKNAPIRLYGENILKLTEKLNKNSPAGITPADLTNTLQVTYDAVNYLQEKHCDPAILAQKAQACADQGAAIVQLSNAKISQGRTLAGLLFGIAGMLLIAASIAFAVATHFLGTPIAIAGISLGASYIAASIGGVGLASVAVGAGLFATRKPNEIQLQEALDNVAQATKKPL